MRSKLWTVLISILWKDFSVAIFEDCTGIFSRFPFVQRAVGRALGVGADACVVALERT